MRECFRLCEAGTRTQPTPSTLSCLTPNHPAPLLWRVTASCRASPASSAWARRSSPMEARPLSPLLPPVVPRLRMPQMLTAAASIHCRYLSRRPRRKILRWLFSLHPRLQSVTCRRSHNYRLRQPPRAVLSPQAPHSCPTPPHPPRSKMKMCSLMHLPALLLRPPPQLRCAVPRHVPCERPLARRSHTFLFVPAPPPPLQPRTQPSIALLEHTTLCLQPLCIRRLCSKMRRCTPRRGARSHSSCRWQCGPPRSQHARSRGRGPQLHPPLAVSCGA